MKYKNVIAMVILAALLAAIPFILTSKASCVQNDGQDNAALMAKLDQVIDGQKAIMSQLDAVKQELNIVKIRITQAQ